MTRKMTRRTFLTRSSVGVAALTGAAGLTGKTQVEAAKREYGISLAGWSLHRTIGVKGGEGKVPQLDMPKIARQEFGIEAIELVSTMLRETTKDYIDQLSKNAADNDVKILLIMIDDQGSIGSRSRGRRSRAVKNHSKWVDIAADLGCHSIRMNWGGAPLDVVQDRDELKEFIDRSVEPLQKLCDYGDKKNINIIIENHGGASSSPAAIEQLMGAVDHERFGTLPDFGNFPSGIDKYDAVDRLMKYAKAVSAKCYDFDDETGLETSLDFERLIQIAVDKHGYNGYIGIEYEGDRLSESEGIMACKKLLEKLRG